MVGFRSQVSIVGPCFRPNSNFVLYPHGQVHGLIAQFGLHVLMEPCATVLKDISSATLLIGVANSMKDRLYQPPCWFFDSQQSWTNLTFVGRQHLNISTLSSVVQVGDSDPIGTKGGRRRPFQPPQPLASLPRSNCKTKNTSRPQNPSIQVGFFENGHFLYFQFPPLQPPRTRVWP